MPLEIQFNYDKSLDPPAPFVSVELRSPAFPTDPNPVQIKALIDSGADGSLIPQALIMKLDLRKVDDVGVGDYNAERKEDFKKEPLYSVHLTLPPLKPVQTEVTALKYESYAIIGRDVINHWLLTLNGPELKGLIKI